MYREMTEIRIYVAISVKLAPDVRIVLSAMYIYVYSYKAPIAGQSCIIEFIFAVCTCIELLRLVYEYSIPSIFLWLLYVYTVLSCVWFYKRKVQFAFLVSFGCTYRENLRAFLKEYTRNIAFQLALVVLCEIDVRGLFGGRYLV